MTRSDKNSDTHCQQAQYGCGSEMLVNKTQSPQGLWQELISASLTKFTQAAAMLPECFPGSLFCGSVVKFADAYGCAQDYGAQWFLL